PGTCGGSGCQICAHGMTEDHDFRFLRLLPNIACDLPPLAEAECRQRLEVFSERADFLREHIETAGIIKSIRKRPADEAIHPVAAHFRHHAASRKFIAAQVAGPTMPSSCKECRVWNSRAACFVFGP